MGTKRTPVAVGTAPTYDTPLAADKVGGFKAWAAALPRDLQNTEDYDLQGAYAAGAQGDARAHMTDQFKKPNHITFSTGSQYSTPAAPGGKWIDDTFWASKLNLANTPLVPLVQYFQRAEPQATLIAPIDYTLPPGK